MQSRKMGQAARAVMMALMLMAVQTSLSAIAVAQGTQESALDSPEGTVVFGDLMWATAINRENTIWRTASRYCGALDAGGYDDWRLPTLFELESLYVPDADGAYKIRSPLELDSCCVWSGTNLERLGQPEGDSPLLDPPFLYAWGLMFNAGIRYYSAMHQVDGQTLCVRDLASPSEAQPAQPAGADSTVVFGELMWANRTNGQYTNWMTASTHCRESELAGYNDWRLPTLFELETIYMPDSDAALKVRSPIELDSCCAWSTTNLEELATQEDLETIRHEPWLNAWGLVFSSGIRYFSYMLMPDGQALCVRDHQQDGDA